MKKLTIKGLVEKFQSVPARFTFPLFFIVGTSILLFLEINEKNVKIPDALRVFFVLSIPLSMAVSLLVEEFKKKLTGIFLHLSAISLLALFAYSLPEKMIACHFYQVVVLGIAFIFLSFVVSFFRKNSDIPFWEFSKTSMLQLLIAAIFALVLMLGLSLAVLSLRELFQLDIDEEIYANIAVLCFGLFAPVFFLSNVPTVAEKHKLEYKFDNFLKILGLYILIPILALYTLILYIYLVQIIAKWELPNGWVTWLVSVLAMGGFLCMLLIYPLQSVQNRIAAFFSRYFPLLLFPLLLLMTVGIFRRFDDYGLTVNRAYVFLLNFWLIGVSIYLFLSKSKHLKWIVVSFSVIAFLSVIGPWSVLNITKQTMMSDIGELLSKNNYLKDGKVKDATEISKIKIDSKTEQQLASKIFYMDRNFGVENLNTFFYKPFKNASEICDFLGINLYNVSLTGNNYFAVHPAEEDKVLDIKGYSHYIDIRKGHDNDSLFGNGSYKVIHKNGELYVYRPSTKNPIIIKLQSRLTEIKGLREQELSLDDRTINGTDFKLIITYINGEIKPNNQIRLDQFEAILFLK